DANARKDTLHEFNPSGPWTKITEGDERKTTTCRRAVIFLRLVESLAHGVRAMGTKRIIDSALHGSMPSIRILVLNGSALVRLRWSSASARCCAPSRPALSSACAKIVTVSM